MVEAHTKLRDKRRAREWCESLQAAQDLIGAGSPPEAQLRSIISETMTRIGHDLKTPSTRRWFEAWISAREGTAAPSTISKYRTAVTSFLKFLGPRANSPLERIVQPDIVAFRNSLVERGMTPPTVNQIVLRIIGSGFNLAFRQGIIRFNPTAGLRPLKDPGRQRKQAFAIEDVRKLLTAASGDWRGAILCGYSSGMRLGDVTNLRWEDVDMDESVIAFTQRKTGAQTIIGLHEDFKEWLSSQPRNDGPIFPSLNGVRTGGRGGLSDQFSRIMDAAGIQSKLTRTRRGKGQTVRALSFHSFRHGAASAVFSAKVIEESVNSLTGHGRGQSHKHYLHIDIASVRAATSMIPRL